MQKENQENHPVIDNRLFYLKSGVYLSASAQNPRRVSVKGKTPVVVVENRSGDFVVAMVDSQTLVLAHQDSIEIIQ